MTTILTLHLDNASQARFEALRQQHFPPARNQIPAHLTLFHALPAAGTIETALQSAADSQPVFEMQVTGLRSLGKGVVYKLASPELNRLHADLAETFRDHLIPQDLQAFHPHIVVQNKVTPEAARTLLSQLTATFQTTTAHALGLDFWEYLGGPWKHLQTYPFRPS